MFPRLLFIFIAVPMVELGLLIEIGSHIGTMDTIILIIVTGIIGAYLAKQQGLRTFLQIQENLRQGIMPTEELLDGLLILTAGAVLLTPGFLTDVFGFLLLIPTTRNNIKNWLKNRFQNRISIHKDYTD